MIDCKLNFLIGGAEYGVISDSTRVIRLEGNLTRLLPHPGQPIDVIGRLIPHFNGEQWDVSEEVFESIETRSYPDDEYDPDKYVEQPDKAAFLALYKGKCVGYIRVAKRWNGNGFIEDVTVDRAFRGCGIGRRLMDAAVRWSKETGLSGISLETQDWNLPACRFYLRYGFELGGVDTRVYTGPYAGEKALYFYLKTK